MVIPDQNIGIPSVKERPDLMLAPSTVWTPDSIGAAAERGAKVANLVLSVDKKLVEDIFTGQLEGMELEGIPEGLVPVVSVRIGARDESGKVWTPSHVVNGHDQLTTKNGRKVPETSVWGEMFANRPADWWNKRRSEGSSQLIEASLSIVLADTALRGTNKNWVKQQAELQKLVDGHRSAVTTIEGMTPLEWEMMDADAIIGGTDRPDEQTLTRFVQHEQDRSDVVGAFGPSAGVVEGQANLGGSLDDRSPDVGFRSVMGPKQTS